MRKVTIQKLVKDLQGKVIRVESTETYGINLSFWKARIEYDATMNELSFVAGRYDTPEGIGGVGFSIGDVVESITLNDNGSYTLTFNQYMPEIIITKSNM